MTSPIAAIEWDPGYRITPGRFSPLQLFEWEPEPNDLEAILEHGSQTSLCPRDEFGEISVALPEDRVSAPCIRTTTAAFIELNSEGSGFIDVAVSVFYATNNLETAFVSTRYRFGRFMRAKVQTQKKRGIRPYLIHLAGYLYALWGQKAVYLFVRHNDSKASILHLAKSLRRQLEQRRPRRCSAQRLGRPPNNGGLREAFANGE